MAGQITLERVQAEARKADVVGLPGVIKSIEQARELPSVSRLYAALRSCPVKLFKSLVPEADDHFVDCNARRYSRSTFYFAAASISAATFSRQAAYVSFDCIFSHSASGSTVICSRVSAGKP